MRSVHSVVQNYHDLKIVISLRQELITFTNRPIMIIVAQIFIPHYPSNCSFMSNAMKLNKK